VAVTPVPQSAAPPRRRRWHPALVASLMVVAFGLLFAGVSGLKRSGPYRLWSPLGPEMDAPTALGAGAGGDDHPPSHRQKVSIPLGPLVRVGKAGGVPFQVVLGNPNETIVGSGRSETKTYDLKGFTGIEVSGPFTVELKQGKDFKVAVTADDNLFEHLRVGKDGAKLRIGFKGKNVRFRLSREQPLQAAITLPTLEDLHLNGAAQASAEGFKAGRPLGLHLNGASRLKGSFQASDVRIDANGASTVQLAGSGKNVRIKANGASRLNLAEFAASGDRLIIEAAGASSVTLKGSMKAGMLQAVGASQLHLRDLTLAAAEVTLVGASRTSVRVREVLDYSVTGASHLDYYGDPKIGKSSKQGASHVSHKE
jgi:Putative auto-transporter adhesin, head GIN domain